VPEIDDEEDEDDEDDEEEEAVAIDAQLTVINACLFASVVSQNSLHAVYLGGCVRISVHALVCCYDSPGVVKHMLPCVTCVRSENCALSFFA
jgi:hypothetical protein